MKKKACIIFPPNYRDFTKPDILIGKVSGYLEHKNVPHDVFDMNILWVRYLLSEEGLLKTKQYCEEQFRLLEQKQMLSGIEQKKYEAILWISCIPFSDLKKEAEECLLIFQKEQFYQIGKLIHANRFLTNVINAANMSISKDRIPLFYSSDYIWKTASEEGLRQDYYAKTVSAWNAYENYVLLVASEAQLLDAFFILRRIKMHQPNANFIIAGHSIGILGESLNQKLVCDLDFAVTGEIEHGIYALIEHTEAPNEIPDVFVRTADNRFKRTSTPQMSVNDRWISYANIDPFLYLSPVTCVPFSITFGCVWGKCSFCNLHKSASAYHEYDVVRAVDNIAYLLSHSKNNLIVFTDEALPPPLLRQLSEEILRRDLKMIWTIQSRFSSLLTSEVYQLIYKAGCRHIEFGLESADEQVQTAMNKSINNQTAARNLADAHKAGLITTVNLITGFPCVEDYSKTEQFLIDNSEVIDRINNFAFYVTKGSDIEKNSSKYGVHVHHNADNDLQMTFTDYQADIGPSRTQIEDRVHQIDAFISKQGSRMEASLCPIWEYLAYYDTTDIYEIIAKSMQMETIQPEIGDTDDVRLQRGLTAALLSFDLIQIIRQFINIVAWMDKAEKLQPLAKQASNWYLLDTLHHHAYPANERLIWTVQALQNTTMTLNELSEAFSSRFCMDCRSALHYLRAMNVIYHLFESASNKESNS